ncbi:Fic family protein [Candidatus Palauibacter sp.]|uniref:Fic family protein n=1 Tax=Candidatus Palauibacter sp. TaxID=3101350 RepID=UPI003AF28440
MQVDASGLSGEGGYEPPFRVTPEIVRHVADIGEAMGRIESEGGDNVRPALRRANRIRTVQSTVEIEGNTLGVEEVAAVLDGRHVRAPPRDLLEVRNAFAAYEAMPDWTSHSVADLLRAHRTMMDGLIEAPGRFRTGGAVVAGPEGVVHIAPPASRVESLMSALLGWLEETDEHPLIASSVFHFEFEFIHPFADGNGRMGRLWQTLILARWKPLFAALPVESMIRDHRAGYYEALRESGRAGESTGFVEYALRMIREVVLEHVRTEQVTEQVRRLLAVMDDSALSARELMSRLHLTHRPNFLYNYLRPALRHGFIAMTRPDAPRAHNQRYRLTPSGRHRAAAPG